MEPFTALLLLTAATLLASAFRTPRNHGPQPQSFDTDSVPQVDEGTRVIEVFGDVNIDNWMVLGYGDYRTTKITTKQPKK